MAPIDQEICHIVRDNDNEPVKYSFDARKLVVTPPRALKKGKFSNVKYSGSSLYFETPILHLPMGISSFEDEGKKSLFVSCRGHEDATDVKLFVDALESLQNRIIDQAADLKLLGEKSSSRDLIAEFMTPIIKPSDKYPPAFRVALPTTDGKYTVNTFKKEAGKTVPCDLDDVEVRGARAKIIFTMSSVWVVNNKNWGVSLKATQLLLRPSFDLQSVSTSCFRDENLGEDSEGEHDGFDQVESDAEL